jgi:hypothetical protein
VDTRRKAGQDEKGELILLSFATAKRRQHAQAATPVAVAARHTRQAAALRVDRRS